MSPCCCLVWGWRDNGAGGERRERESGRAMERAGRRGGGGRDGVERPGSISGRMGMRARAEL